MQQAVASRRRVVLVTGASTGIGLALVRELLKTDMRIVATARDSSLPRFGSEGLVDNERLLIRPLDVTNPVERKSLINEISMMWNGVDVLVNNAGLTVRAVMEDISPDEEQKQFDVNYFGPMELARLVLPRMRAKRSGHIINVSSVGGMMAMPTMGPYSASKFALEGGSEALYYELKPWGVNVTLFEPGFVHSDSFRHARITRRCRDSLADDCSTYYHYYSNMLPFIERMMKFSPTRPENIARRIVRTMNSGKPPLRVPATLDAWFFFYLRKFLPRRLYHAVLYRGLPNIKSWVDQDA